MYIIRDALSPAIKSHTDAAAFKNTILRYFPRQTVNGVETFGILLTSIAGVYVIDDNQHRRLYHVLGMKMSEMKKQDYSGTDATYIYVNAYNGPNGVVSQTDIRNYIEYYTPLIYPTHKNAFNPDPLSVVDMNPDPNIGTATAYWDANGWITVPITYQPTTVSLIDNAITDAQILQKVRDISPTEIFFDPHHNNRLAALAILDLNTNAVFETSLRIISKTLKEKDTLLSANSISGYTNLAADQTRYVVSAQIELKFRRVVDCTVGLTLATAPQAFVSLVESSINSLTSIPVIQNAFGIKSSVTTSLDTTKGSISRLSRNLSASVNQQLVILANWVNPYPVGHALVVTDSTLTFSYYASKTETSIRVDGMMSLPPKQFKKTFLSLMGFNSIPHENPGHWYDTVVSIVIAIVAIVMAIWTGGNSLWIAAAWLAGGAMAESLWAMYLVKNGGSPSSIHATLGFANALGIASMIVGIASIYQQWVNQGIKEAALKAAEKEAVSSVESGASQAVIDQAAQNVITAYADATATSMATIVSDAISSVTSLLDKVGVDTGPLGQVASLLSGSYDTFTSAGTTKLEEISLKTIENSIQEGIKQFFSKPLSEILNQCLNWINSGFNAYMSYVSPPNEGLADKKAQLDATNKEVESTSPEHAAYTWSMYTDPYDNIFDMNKTDISIIMLTTGKNQTLMNKCYDSGWKL